MIKCPECEQEFEKANVLFVHLKQVHNEQINQKKEVKQ